MEPEIVNIHSDYTSDCEEQRTEEPKKEPFGENVSDCNPTEKTEFSMKQLLLPGYRISEFIDEIPSYFGYFFTAYKRLLVSIGLILVAFVVVILALAVLEAINDLPLFPQLLKLIGLIYTTWFIYYYLISTDGRQTLSEVIDILKEYIWGREN